MICKLESEFHDLNGKRVLLQENRIWSVSRE